MRMCVRAEKEDVGCISLSGRIVAAAGATIIKVLIGSINNSSSSSVALSSEFLRSYAQVRTPSVAGTSQGRLRAEGE